jgi:hypothetical protein
MSHASTTNPSSSFAGSSAGAATSTAHPRGISRAKLWAGRILSGLVVLFMLFDVVGKLIRPVPAPVAAAFARLGFPLSLATSIAILLLVSTIVYSIPRKAVLGAVLLTGYLGGAVAIHLRAGSSTFETVFPVIFGAIAWTGIMLREPRLLQLFPRRCLGR